MSYQDPESPDVSPETPPLSKDETMWGMFCHLSGLALLTGIPFANVIGPLVVWLIKKDEMPFVDDQGKEALNFQISVAIYVIVSFVLIFALIGVVLLPAVAIFALVMTIIASLKANQGEAYRYPLCIRFLK